MTTGVSREVTVSWGGGDAVSVSTIVASGGAEGVTVVVADAIACSARTVDVWVAPADGTDLTMVVDALVDVSPV